MKFRKIAALFLCGVMTLSLTACNSGGESANSDSSSSDSGETVTLNIGSSGSYFVSSLEASGVDAIASVTSYGIFSLVYDTVFYANEDGEMVSDIIESYEYSDDMLTLTLQLKDGIYYASGDKMTGEDILFSIACKQTSSKPAYYTPINLDKSSVSDDGLTITLFYDFVFGPGIKYLDFYVINKSHYESLAPDGDYTKVNWYDPAVIDGSGPYVITDFVQDTMATVELRDDYWGDSSRFDVDIYNLYTYTDATTMYIDFENKVLDVAIGLSSEDATRLNDGDLDFGQLGLVDSNAVTMLCMNENNEYLADPAVREAIAYALDTEVLTEVCVGIYGTVAKSTLSESMTAFVDGYSYPYDPAHSREVLAEAGYSDGEIVLTYITTSDTEQSTLAEMVQGYLDDVGITVNIETYDMATMLPSLMQGLSDFQRQTASDGSPQREVYEVYSALTSDSVFPAVGITDEEINYYLNEGYRNVDEDVRNAAYEQVQRLLYESYRCIPLYESKAGYAYNTEVIGSITLLSASKPNLLMVHPR